MKIKIFKDKNRTLIRIGDIIKFKPIEATYDDKERLSGFMMEVMNPKVLDKLNEMGYGELFLEDEDGLIYYGVTAHNIWNCILSENELAEYGCPGKYYSKSDVYRARNSYHNIIMKEGKEISKVMYKKTNVVFNGKYKKSVISYGGGSLIKAFKKNKESYANENLFINEEQEIEDTDIPKTNYQFLQEDEIEDLLNSIEREIK